MLFRSSYLTSPIDIVKHVLQHYFHAPKSINDTFADSAISFRHDDATSGADPAALTLKVTNVLTDTFSKYFPSATTIDVDVNYIRIDDVRYDIVLDIIVVIDGVPYTFEESYTTDDEGHLTYKYKGE